MISHKSGSGCDEARGYYYDWLDDQCKQEMPQGICAHINRCDHCLEEIGRLDQALQCASAPEPREEAHVAMINGLLEMHFKYAETPVTCCIAKPFLPSMASPEITITLPTPITVHIEQCPSCRNEWLELQSLGLSDGQLQNLTQVLENKAFDSVRFAHKHLTDEEIQMFARVEYSELDSTCLEHVSACVSCRERVLMTRQAVAAQSMPRTDFCQDLTWEDLFDLALPVGSNPLIDEYSHFREAMFVHVRNCETCLSRLASLDQIIVNVLKPCDSGVVTNVSLDLHSGQAGSHAGYEGYGLRVDVQGPTKSEFEEAIKDADIDSVRVGARSRTGWIKVAAVVILFFGLTISFILPQADAGFLDVVYEATTSAPVVHMKAYAGGGSEVSIEYWIFPPDRAVRIEGQTRTVYDAETAKNSDMRRSIRGRISGLYDLWPLEVRQSADVIPEKYNDFEVYKWTWEGERTTHLWHAHVHTDTHRVQKVEQFEEEQNKARSQTWLYEVDYPTLAEAETFLQQQDISFD